MATTKSAAPAADDTTPRPLVALLAEASAAIGAVRKDRQAPGNIGGFMFRGVDAVVNAAHPALTSRGILIVPEVLEHHRETVPTNAGRTMMNVTVRTRFTFHGPAGDSLSVTTLGEAADAGDKASSKAQSVALRVALLQALLLPTDEPDPDESGYERAAPASRPATAESRPAGRSLDQAAQRGPRVDRRWREAYDALTPSQQTWVRANWPDPRPPADLSTEDVSKALEWLASSVPPPAADERAATEADNPPA